MKLFFKYDPATSSIPGSVLMFSGNGLMQISWLTIDDGLVGLQDSVEEDELSHRQPPYSLKTNPL